MITHPIGKFAPRPSPLSADERSELIARWASAPAKLREVLAGLGPAGMDVPYREGGWTPRQIVHHMADSHLIGFVRIKRALNEDEPPVFAYDPDEWVSRADAEGAPAEDSLRILDGIHERLSRLFDAMSSDDFARRLVHPTSGPVDVDFLLQLYTWHGDHHRAQIEGLASRLAEAGPTA